MRYLPLLLICLTLAMPASADFQAGLDAYRRGDYPVALREWRPIAEQGNANAQYNIGLMHHKGQGVTQDPAEAIAWYQRAAEQGIAKAQNNLGLMYFERQGVARNYFHAHKWFHLAAVQGQADAQRNLGLMYFEGLGVRPDYHQAYKWFYLSAASGDERGKRELNSLARIMPPVGIAFAERLVREWRRSHPQE